MRSKSRKGNNVAVGVTLWICALPLLTVYAGAERYAPRGRIMRFCRWIRLDEYAARIETLLIRQGERPN